MKKLIKLLFWLVGLAFIFISAAVILVASIDPAEHKDWIAAKVQQKTGRALSLDGNIAITLYPWLGLEASEVSIGNAEGFGVAPFAHLDYVKLRVKSVPLLRNQYEVDTVNVKGAVINLARNKQGVSNWDDFIEEVLGGKISVLSLAATTLGGVAIEDARITWDDQQTAVRYEVSDLDVSTAELKYGEPVDISLSFHGIGNKPAIVTTVKLTGIITYDTDERQYGIAPLDISALIRGKNVPGGETTATLSADVDVNLDAETVSVSNIRGAALGATIKGNLSAGQIESPTPSIAASVDAQGENLGLLLKVAEIEPLASQLSGLANRSFQIGMTMDADLGRGDIDLSELSANLLGAVVTGEVKARNIHSDTPGYQGSLNARGPDLPTLMQVLGQLQGGKDAPLTDYGEKLAGIPAKAFRVAVVFDADLKSGDVAVPELSLKALGITATGALDARNMQTGKGTVRGDLNVKGSEITGLLKAIDQADLAQVLQSVEFDTQLQGTRAGIVLEPLSVKAVFDGKDIPGSPVNMTLDTDTRFNMDKETLILDRFTLDGLGLKSAGNIKVRDVFDTPVFSGEIEVQPFNLRKLAQQLNQALPVTADEKALTSVALSGRFDGSATDLNVERLAFRLDDTRLTGEFSITDMKENPAMQFDLEVDEINLDRYRSPEPKTRKRPRIGQTQPRRGQSTGNGGTTAAQTPGIPVDTLRALAVKGDVSIDSLVVHNALLNGVKLRLSARDRIVKAAPMLAVLYEGELSGNLNLDMNPDIPTLTFDANLTGIQAEPLLMDLKGEAKLRGRGDFSVALSTAGTTGESMKRNLNGRMSMSFSDGALIGFNLGRTLRQWKQFKTGGSFDLKETELTDFSVLTGNPIAKAGVIRMDDMDLKAPAFRMKGKGVLANLHTDSIDYKASVGVVNTSKGAGGKELGELVGLELPIRVNGPLDNPKITLDWSNILGTLLINEILDAIDLPVPAADKPGDGTETNEEPEFDPVKELLKEGLKSIFKR